MLRNEQSCNLVLKSPEPYQVRSMTLHLSCTMDFPTIICLGLGGTWQDSLSQRPSSFFLCNTQTGHSFLATTRQGNRQKINRKRSSTLNAFNVRVGHSLNFLIGCCPLGVNAQKESMTEQPAWQEISWFLASRGDWCCDSCADSRRLHPAFLFQISSDWAQN